MSTRHHVTALLAGAIITMSACGGQPDARPSVAGTPATRPVATEHAIAWQAYYDVTHPAPTTPRHTTAWQAYYDATHPAPAPAPTPTTDRHTTAWQAYYDATHP
jgi:hypothetical protein